VKKSEVEAGRSRERAEEIAARAVNKEKARSGQSKSSSRASTRRRSPVRGAASAPAKGRAGAPATSSTRTPGSSASKAARRWTSENSSTRSPAPA